MATGTLYLIPNTLGETPAQDVLSMEVLRIAAGLDYLVADEQTRYILLHVERVRHARKFMSALRSAARFGVKKAAALYSVSPASLYKWRKVPALMKQMMEVDDD